MPSPPSSSSSSVQAARQHLADQLREIRQDAGLTGRKLAELAGWHGVAKVSKIEHAARPISPADLRTWCRVCEIPPERTAELLGELRAVTTMWTDYQRLNRAGLAGAQKSVRGGFDRARLIRTYGSRTFPGLAQTQEFTAVALEQARIRQGVHADDPQADLAAAVTERMDRQRVLHGRGRFLFLVEEAVLRYRLCPADVHAGQVQHLLEVMRLPSVSLGVLPFTADREVPRPIETFTITDDREVNVELLTGWLRITQPSEVTAYARQFAAMAEVALYGDAARRLINAVLHDLEG